MRQSGGFWNMPGISTRRNDYTGGVMSSECGSLGVCFPVHCVLATGFYRTAPIPYWIMGTAGLLGVKSATFDTCGVAVDATFPEVALDMTNSSRASLGSTVDTYSASTGGFWTYFKQFLRVSVLGSRGRFCPALQRR